MFIDYLYNQLMEIAGGDLFYAKELLDDLTTMVKQVIEQGGDELNGAVRDKMSVCGFDKEDALRQRWGE